MEDQVFETLAARCAYLWDVDVATVKPETTFEEHDTKSGDISKMTTYLEDEYDVEFPYLGFKKNKTVGDAAAWVAGLREE